MYKDKRISKRDFIKYSLMGFGGASLALHSKTNIASRLFFPEMQQDPLKLMENAKEAMYYEKMDETRMLCQLCPHECIIFPKKRGDCHNRINYKGKLYTIAYANPCAVHVDPIEKKPLFHFLPTSKALSIATAGCNLSCMNCQNWNISQVGPEETRNYDLPPQKVVETCINYNCDSIAYTYSEPIAFYEYTYDTSVIARQKGIKNIFISAGYIQEKPLRKISKYLDAANIDLKSFDDDTYKRLNAGSLKPILNTLKTLKEEGVWVEITNLIVPSWTDDMDMIKKMCEWLAENGLGEAPLHFSRFTPRYKLKHLPVTPVSKMNKARKIAQQAGMKYVYVGNVPGHEGESTFCPECEKVLLKRRGFYILQNNLNNNQCKYCGAKIAGVWEK